MAESNKVSLFQLLAAVTLLTIGLAVFAVRLFHAGEYAMPGGAALIGSVILILFGGVLLWAGTPRWSKWIILAISPLAIFPAVYSIVGESEEVISLFAQDSTGKEVDLRLWIVDREDGAWVGMSRDKAINHSLDGARLEMLRAGSIQCVIPMLTGDRETTRIIHAMKVQKYAAARIAGAIGLYPLEASENTAALRLDPCEQK